MQSEIEVEEMNLIHGLHVLEDGASLSAYGIQDGTLYCLMLFREHHQSNHETLRRKEEEEEEDLHQAQENKAQAQKESKGPS